MDEVKLREWIEIAKSDYDVAIFLQTMYPTPLEIICYHCQQSGEKFLKGYLCYCGKDIPKTHDLTKLCKLCTELDSSFEGLEADSAILSVYATGTRYPDREEILEIDMRFALKSAENIANFVNYKVVLPD